jgi:ADP-ribosylglycohydrolase
MKEAYKPDITLPMYDRARGCMLGQLVGDSLGSLVEFESPEQIRRKYPEGIREMVDGGTFNLIAGQPTDDSEMALSLARSLVRMQKFDRDDVRQAYVDWMNSNPFDIGGTTSSGLRGHPSHDSQANGALMRISPLGIFGSTMSLQDVADLAAIDAALTHPNPVCIEVNRLFTMAVAHVIKEGIAPQALYQQVMTWAHETCTEPTVLATIMAAEDGPPADFMHKQGWVLLAFQNALWQLHHADSFEDALVDTIMRGGDTDTTAAICGALLGAAHGLDNIPKRWTQTVLSCRPEKGLPNVKRPRPQTFWPCDAIELADQLLETGRH